MASSLEKKCSWISVNPSSSTSIRPLTVSTVAINPTPPVVRPVPRWLEQCGTGKDPPRQREDLMFRHVTTRFAGLVILIAGLWGGLVPFVGPYFHFALGPIHSWTWTSGRFYLSVLPAAAAILGGLILLFSGPRISGRIGALLALAGGVWFAIGPTVSLLWATDAEGLA